VAWWGRVLLRLGCARMMENTCSIDVSVDFTDHV